MHINVETVAPCRKRVQLTIPPDRVREELESSIRTASANIRLPGFRPGHVPRLVIEKKYGVAIRREVKEHLVNEGYQQALRDHNILPLTQPQIDLESLALDEAKGLTVDFEFDARPEIEPKGYKGVPITIERTVATDEDVEREVAGLRKSRRRPEQDSSAALDEDAFALVSIVFKRGNDTVLSRDSVRVMVGTRITGADEKEFNDKLRGKRVGESFELAMTYPDDFEVKDVIGENGIAILTIREVYRLIPPSDEEILKAVDLPDFDALRAVVRNRIQDARDADTRRATEDAILETVIEGNAFEIPDRIIDDQVASRVAQQKEQIEKSDSPPENAEETIAQERARLRPNMDKALRRLFLMEAIARKEKIFVTEDDLENEFHSIAQRNQSKVNEVAQYYHDNGLMNALRLDLLEIKVRAFLYENASRTEKGGRPGIEVATD